MNDMQTTNIDEIELFDIEDLNLVKQLDLTKQEVLDANVLPNIENSYKSHSDVKKLKKPKGAPKDFEYKFVSSEDVDNVLKLYVQDVSALATDNELLKGIVSELQNDVLEATEHYNSLTQRTNNMDEQIKIIDDTMANTRKIIKEAEKQQEIDTQRLKELAKERNELQASVSELSNEVEELKAKKLELEAKRDELISQNETLANMNKDLEEKGVEIETKLMSYNEVSKNHMELIRDMRDSAITLQEIHDKGLDRYLPIITKVDIDSLNALLEEPEILHIYDENFKLASYNYYKLSNDINDIINNQVELAKKFGLEFESGAVLSKDGKKDNLAMSIYEEGKAYEEELKSRELSEGNQLSEDDYDTEDYDSEFYEPDFE